MGGSSNATCENTSNGLLLNGFLVEENGGFISCRSPLFSPPLDLSNQNGIEIYVDGYGKTLKLAISCKYNFLNLSTLYFDRLKWVVEFNTLDKGTTKLKIPFCEFRPTLRTKSYPSKVEFKLGSINQFQLLYSKFGMPGYMNESFKPGPINILLRALSAYT